ncbi:hypothetical protein [Roseibium sp. Sym1]|uniref:hypothetical protein n=1 Tax=Roseibium sp. Sym1 TaxID=3016006 RepID=UPI0022B534D2|nr:hypothetical protein [Roseibium sp. Sym1]
MEEMPEPVFADEEIAFANILILLKSPIDIRCDYTNWRGETAERHLRVLHIWHGATEWHTDPGLMLKAIDLERAVERDFKVVDFDLSTLRAA